MHPVLQMVTKLLANYAKSKAKQKVAKNSFKYLVIVIAGTTALPIFTAVCIFVMFQIVGTFFGALAAVLFNPLSLGVTTAEAQTPTVTNSNYAQFLPLTPPANGTCPVNGAVISQPFGPSSLWLEPPYNGYDHFHQGIDLAAPTGTPIVAAQEGQVIFSGGTFTIGYGIYVRIGVSKSRQEYYGHMLRTAVQTGQFVNQGQVIGFIDSSGNSTGPHLHFGVMDNGRWIDPQEVSRC